MNSLSDNRNSSADSEKYLDTTPIGLPRSSALMDIAIGVDLVEYEYFRRGENDARFLQRVYTKSELAYCESKRDPLPFLAARFAAKEAVIKAFGQYGIALQFSDIEIVRSVSGQVSVAVKKQSKFLIHLSFAHGQESAVAVVMVRRA